MSTPVSAMEAASSSIEIRAIDPARDKEQLELFLRVPWSLGLQHDPVWVPPLLDDYRRILDPKRSAFLKHARMQCFLALQGGRPVGRISAQLDYDFDHHWPSEAGLGFFGFFESADDPAVARALFRAAENWTRAQGRTRLRGPFTPDSKSEMGVLIHGFEHPPRIGMAYNKPYVQALVEGAGYTKAKDLYAWWYQANSPIDPLTKKIADRTRALPNVRVRTMDLKHMRREAEIVREVFNEAWERNWNFVPLTLEELEVIATEYKQFLDPEIALVAEVDGKPAAICLAVPDINELIKDFDGELMKRPLNLVKLLWRLKFARPKAARLILLGVKKEYRASRKYGALVAVLYEEVAVRGSKRGYTGGELGWTLEDNDQINIGIARMGAKHYKTYRVYEKSLV
ncbi:MAG TPA: hypothetical protein VJV78_18880 [Polyangiales bacterium]|nr:hypothetical protein [Polyangiales bacterium]